MTGNATTTLAQLTRRLGARITTLLESGPVDWSLPSPCDDWDAGDVLDHLMETERDLLTEHGVALGELPDGDRTSRWRAHVDQLAAALEDPAVVDHAYDGYFGPTTIGETFGGFYTLDLVVHRWDLARALGRSTTFDQHELELVRRAIEQGGDALYTEGICEPAVSVPDDATRQQRLLALTGRDPFGPGSSSGG